MIHLWITHISSLSLNKHQSRHVTQSQLLSCIFIIHQTQSKKKCIITISNIAVTDHSSQPYILSNKIRIWIPLYLLLFHIRKESRFISFFFCQPTRPTKSFVKNKPSIQQTNKYNVSFRNQTISYSILSTTVSASVCLVIQRATILVQLPLSQSL